MPHRQVVLTIPKTLRIFFKYRRRLLGELSRAAVKALTVYFEALGGETLVAVLDKIIRHLGLTFVAERPPPSRIFGQAALMAAEENRE